MNYQEIQNARGFVVGKFVDIELTINSIISIHYLKEVNVNFVINVLNNEMSSFGLKKNILKQIVNTKKYKKQFENLETLNRIRNLFGHVSLCLTDETKNIKDANAKIHLNNPKKPDDKLNPDEKLKEFKELFNSVLNWLIEIGKEKGVPFS